MTHKILIVEDEISLSDAYHMLLKQAKYDVEVAHDGKEALEKASQKQPDLILLDLRMPVLDGVGFLKQYDLANKHPEVKVIVFSNYDMQEEIDEAYRLGAERYILKAWASPREILNLVRDALSGKNKLGRNQSN